MVTLNLLEMTLMLPKDRKNTGEKIRMDKEHGCCRSQRHVFFSLKSPEHYAIKKSCRWLCLKFSTVITSK